METKSSDTGILEEVEVEGELKVSGPDRDEFYQAQLKTPGGTLRAASRSALFAVQQLLRELGIRD
jgi:hypothetical protein